MMIDVTAAEKYVVDRLREVKKSANGHGSVRVDVVERQESLVRIEYTGKPPR